MEGILVVLWVLKLQMKQSQHPLSIYIASDLAAWRYMDGDINGIEILSSIQIKEQGMSWYCKSNAILKLLPSTLLTFLS